ncbi:MAG: NAD kinase, partial [Cyclobacteriaceae bacterium]|nr:NAD kinase [Cyclobacteriaceae bacterium]
MNIAIHGKKIDQNSQGPLLQLLGCLKEKEASVIISETLLESLQKTDVQVTDLGSFSSNKDLQDVDFIFSLGGDGTLLETVAYVGKLELPIVGINTGRLGFLATISKDMVTSAVEALYHNEFAYDHRTLVRVHSDQDIFNGINFGLNDFTILKQDTSSMITVHAYIDGEYLNSYWADGLIVATPTGSTGYSLSCGGPVVLPQSDNFVITPVSPHNLTVRPLVVSDNSVISFEIEGRSKNFLVSLDTRSFTVEASIQMAVSKEEFQAKLV